MARFALPIFSKCIPPRPDSFALDDGSEQSGSGDGRGRAGTSTSPDAGRHPRPRPDASRALIEEVGAQLMSVNEELRRHQDALVTLREKAARLKFEISSLQQITSPISKLPPEILPNILIHALPDDTFVLPAASSGPLLLAQVCTHWRDIVLSTPELWESLCLLLGSNTRRNRNRLNILETWLERSSYRPLSIYVGGDGVSPADDCFGPRYPAIPFWDIIRPHSHRLRRFEIILPLTYLRSLAEAPPHTLLLLERLTLFTAGRQAPNEIILNGFLSSVGTLPKLSKLVVHGPFDSRATNILWSRLRMLGMDCEGATHPLPLDDACRILRESSQLRRCIMRISSRSPILHQGEPIVIPFLNNLSISFGSDGLGELLDCVTLPSLTETLFMVHGRAQAIGWPGRAFRDFLQRSSCQIRSLTVDTYSGFLPSDLMQCLVHLPSLTTLRFPGSAIDRDAYHAFSPTRHPVLAPKLRNLMIRGRVSCRSMDLARLIISRFRCASFYAYTHVAPFEEVILIGLPLSLEALKTLLAWREVGLRLTIRQA